MQSMTLTQEAISTTIKELVARSNRLGLDPRNTNETGGNTSAQETAIDPAMTGPA
jgi:rhamnose utilization protein RhaD (predicted bifunctional aldolase and dehydrogenase)